MSKVASATIATAGVAAASVGGAYLIKRNITPHQLLFNTVEEFDHGWKIKPESKCTVGFFEGGFGTDSGTKLESGTTLDSNSFFKTSQDTSVPYKSCLIIDWKREEYENSKWNGKFTWIWTFVKGNEGFVNFNIAETSGSEELVFRGVFYLLDKGTNTGDKWNIKYKKEVTGDTKKVKLNELDQYFPKVGTNISIEEAKKDYWGFLPKDQKGDELKNICSAGDNCVEGQGTPTGDRIELSWTGNQPPKTQTPKKLLKDWSSVDGWWEKIYESTPWSLKSQIANFEGEWKLNTTNSKQSKTS